MHVLNAKLPPLLLLFILSSFLIGGCGGNERTSDSLINPNLQQTQMQVENAMDSAGQKLRNTADDVSALFSANRNPDSTFLVSAIASNEKELKLLQKGLSNGQSAQLKRDAQQMLADHRKLGQQIKGHAQQLGVPAIANKQDQSDDDHDELSRQHKPGPEWDKSWADLMVAEHRNDVRLFDVALNRVQDPELGKSIENAIPLLRRHLEMADSLQTALK